jgi:glyoxylase-like metal-dependent hydrolase (beta-lactamase superfamily II)
VYLIRAKNENPLFDTGNWTLPEFNNGMGDTLVDLLDKEDNELKYIFISHFHYDHVGNGQMLKERYGAQVIAHPLDKPVIEDPVMVARPDMLTRFGTSPEEALADFNLEPGEGLGLSDPEIVKKYWYFPIEVDIEVDDGDMIEFGGQALEVLHLPGHSPGHCGLWNKASGSCYPADLLHFPTPLGPYPVGDAKGHWNAIQRCKALEPTLFLEGHGLGAYDKAASMRRIEHLETQQRELQARIAEVLQRSSGPMTIAELVPEVIPVKVELDYAVWTGKRMMRCFASACVHNHLLWLIEQGKARQGEQRKAIWSSSKQLDALDRTSVRSGRSIVIPTIARRESST